MRAADGHAPKPSSHNALGLVVVHTGDLGDAVLTRWVDWAAEFAKEVRLWANAERDALAVYVQAHSHRHTLCVSEAARCTRKSPVQVARYLYLESMAARQQEHAFVEQRSSESDLSDMEEEPEPEEPFLRGDMCSSVPGPIERWALSLVEQQVLRPLIAQCALLEVRRGRPLGREDVERAMQLLKGTLSSERKGAAFTFLPASSSSSRSIEKKTNKGSSRCP
jgi:hypothetical protein